MLMAEKVMEKSVRVLRPYNNGRPFNKAVQEANRIGARILSNKELDKILVETDVWKSVREAFPVHSGTVEAHKKPGERLGSVVEYLDEESDITWVFPVPSGFKKLKDTILTAEHPDYELEEKGKTITIHVRENKITPVENFPQENGWYKADPRTAVPVNVKLDSENRNARHLWRIDHRVGLLIRGSNYLCSDYYGRRSVLASNSPSNALGVLVEQEMTLETAIKLVEKLQGKLKLAEGMATDARPKLEKLREVVKPESLEELTELIKLLTGREK